MIRSLKGFAPEKFGRNYAEAGESGKQTIGRGAENAPLRRSSCRGQRVGAVSGGADSSGHDPEKWMPVF
jgi:hypothetical protein